MEPTIRPLIASLHEIPDPRYSRGRRHPLVAMLALVCVAMRCGYRSSSAMAEWGRCDGQTLARALGFTQAKAPCAATLSQVLRQRDGNVVEATRGAWAASVLTTLPPVPGELAVRAIDGNTLRGRRPQGAPAVHRLSVLSHRLGLPLWPPAVADKPHASPVPADGWRELVVEGRVMTVDALRTQRAIADRIVQGGGDDVMPGTGNQPQLQHAIQLVFHAPHLLAETMATAETVASGHGRLEQRRLTASSGRVGYSDWPGLAQAFQVARAVIMQKSGEHRHEGVDGVTSLSQAQAGPGRRLSLVRQHWSSEDKSHGVREVTVDEDRAQGRCGSIPQVMAACRNTARGWMHCAGETNIAAACRRVAAKPWAALALSGLIPQN